MDPYDKLNEMYINAYSPNERADNFIQELTAKTDDFYEFNLSPTQEDKINELYSQYRKDQQA